MASSSIDVSLRLRNAKRFQQDASKSGKSVGDIGKGAKKADRDLGRLEKRTGKLRKGFSGLSKGAKLGIGAIGGAAALGAAKQAVGATQDLTKTTIGLQRATKMDNTEAVRWAAQAKVRGIDAKAMNMAMGSLSKNTQLATEGGKSQQKAFDRLGISQKDIAATGGDISKLLPQMADRFKAMGPSQARTTSMMTLMGKGWQTITPLMTDGSKAMGEQLKMADKYGVTLGDKPIKTQKDLLAVQREMKMAQLGWQVQFSTEIAPRLIKAFRWILKTSQSLKGVFAWADRHPGIVKAIGSLALLSAAMKRVPGGAWLGRHILSGTAGVAGKLGKRLGGPIKNTLMRVLGRGGSAAGERGAEALVNSTGSQFGRSQKKLNSTVGGRLKRAGTRWGGTAGKAAGIAFTAGAVIGLAGLGSAVAEVLRSVNTKVDKWAKDKFGSAGSFYSDVKNFIGNNYPAGLPGAGIVDSALGTRPGKVDAVGPKIKRHRQHGGALRAGMSAVVGETRPEVLTARPSGGFIRQLTAPAMRVPQLAGAPAGVGGGGAGEDVHWQPVVFKVGERVLAEGVARATRQKRARS